MYIIMPIRLYYFEASPPVRSVLMAIDALDLYQSVDLVRINLSEKEQLSKEFLKLNPTHTVPTLDDDGFVVWDSHAIVQYLAEKYGQTNVLYPKQLKERTIVNQLLFFDTSILFPSLAHAVRPVFYDDATAVPQEKLDDIESSFEYLEKFLNTNEFLAGNHLTIADLCAIATVSTIEIFHAVNATKYPNVVSWLNKLKDAKFYEANLEGIHKFRTMFLPLLK